VDIVSSKKKQFVIVYKLRTEINYPSLVSSNFDDVLPIYVGDDRTDGDAFKVIYG